MCLLHLFDCGANLLQYVHPLHGIMLKGRSATRWHYIPDSVADGEANAKNYGTLFEGDRRQRPPSQMCVCLFSVFLLLLWLRVLLLPAAMRRWSLLRLNLFCCYSLFKIQMHVSLLQMCAIAILLWARNICHRATSVDESAQCAACKCFHRAIVYAFLWSPVSLSLPYRLFGEERPLACLTQTLVSLAMCDSRAKN